MRTPVIAALLLLGAATGRADEAIVRVDDLDTAIQSLVDSNKGPLLLRGPADATIARLWGLPVDTPVEDALLGRDGAYVRLVKVGPVDAPLPLRRIATTGIVAMRESAKGRLAADLQIARIAPHGVSRAMVLAQNGTYTEFFEPGAKPMTEQELKEFTIKGRFSNWTRFNNKLTGTVVWRPDGSAHVKWDQGTLDEEGTWTIRDDRVCTAWFRLRQGKELCVQHYRLFGDTTQSFRADGTPDGIHSWKAPGQLE